MSTINTYKDLIVYQKSISLIVDVYELLPQLPVEEKYGLRSQLRRAVCSVALNIAEGYGRGTRRDYAHFVANARGSVQEVDTAMDICLALGYLPAKTTGRIQEHCVELRRMLTKLRNRLIEAG